MSPASVESPCAISIVLTCADDSGSMVFEEGGERINDLKLILGRVAEVRHGENALEHALKTERSAPADWSKRTCVEITPRPRLDITAHAS